jgi:hypothetical protein
MDELLKMLSDAVASQNWLVVVAVSIVVLLAVTSMVLKALKKPVPVLDSVVSLAEAGVKMLPKKDPPPPADPSKDGVSAVVPVEKQDTLK